MESLSTCPFDSKVKEEVNEKTPIQEYKDLANSFRRDTVDMTTVAQSGHPTSCASMAEIAAVLFFHPNGMHYDPKEPKGFNADRFVLSKGHAAPLLYSVWAHNGYLEHSSLRGLKQIWSPLTGHPSPSVPFVDVASGSLGQGLSVTMGMAYASKYIDKMDNKFFTLIGDAESAEGQVWEACSFGASYKLDNVIAIIDCNRQGQSGPTIHKHELENYRKKFEAFGCQTIVIDGHDVAEVILALDWARKVKGTPAVIIAKTLKGKNLGVKFEDTDYHGKPIAADTESCLKHLDDMIVNKEKKWTVAPSKPSFERKLKEFKPFCLPPLKYEKGKSYCLAGACGNAFKTLAEKDEDNLLIAVERDTRTSKSTFNFAGAGSDKFVSASQAEQNMVCVSQGLSARGKVPFCVSSGANFSRGYDQIRLVGISDSNVKFVGTHSLTGVEDPSHMSLEDLTMFRAVINTVILYPSDAVSGERAIELAANHKGPVYIRVTNFGVVPVVHGNDDKFEIGKAKVVRKSDKDAITIVTSGLNLHEALTASEQLASEGVHVRVIDLFSIKPVDAETLISNAKETTTQKILTIDDHYPEGGINGAVSCALSESGLKIYGLAVGTTPSGNGTTKDVLEKFGLSASKIAAHVKTLL